jgi:CRISPR/Cas system CSM-associated protein Csm3 (group 7 of RAMP superfamily)
MHRKSRLFVRANLVAESPIKLSSGVDDATDADVLVDAEGVPFIPGTSLVGVIRHYVDAIKKQAGDKDASYVNLWFGYIVPNADKGSKSLVTVYDAFPLGEARVSMRDGVRLTADKTTDGTGKYDYQVVDEGTTFDLRLQIEYDGSSEVEAVNALLSTIVCGINAGEVMVGGKTSRGFGRISVSDVRVLALDLDDEDGIRNYIDFDWERSAFKPFAQMVCKQSLYEEPRVVDLAVASSLMIRDYATLERSGYEQKLVDAQALEGANHNPIVPGTSWAGAFKHHMQRILRLANYSGLAGEDTADAFLSRVFGDVSGARGVASKIEFSQSEVKGSRPINLTRTAIDRFTGGAANEKLFTNRLAFGGTTTLSIRWRKSLSDADKKLLASLVDVCIADLCDGTLAVGGMTATGSGMFRKASDGCAEVTS